MERSLYWSLSTGAGPLHDCRGSEWATLRVTLVSRTRRRPIRRAAARRPIPPRKSPALAGSGTAAGALNVAEKARSDTPQQLPVDQVAVFRSLIDPVAGDAVSTFVKKNEPPE